MQAAPGQPDARTTDAAGGQGELGNRLGRGRGAQRDVCQEWQKWQLDSCKWVTSLFVGSGPPQKSMDHMDDLGSTDADPLHLLLRSPRNTDAFSLRPGKKSAVGDALRPQHVSLGSQCAADG